VHSSAIKIGISRCLIGDPVRYDGASKYSEICCTQLATNYQLIAICPEVDSGLSVPRPPIELIQHVDGTKLIGRDNSSIDVTAKLISFFDSQVALFSSLSGFILTPRSPSCGLKSVAIKSPTGQLLSETSDGFFTASLINNFPYLPLIEEPFLADQRKLLLFQIRVIFYYLIQQNRLHSNQLIKHVTYAKLLVNIEGEETKKNKIITINKLLADMSREQLDPLLNILTENIND